MIVYRCLGCCLPDLPIEALRCPRCGEENFIPLNRTLSAPESRPGPINDEKNFRDTSTEQTAEAKAILTGCSPNQHEETEPMSKTINFWNEEHAHGIDGKNIKVKWDEGAGENNLRYENTVLEQEQLLQICSNDPVLKNSTLEEIPIVYDQAYSSNAEDKDICVSGNVNFSASVSTPGEEPQNRMNFSHQPQRKLENQSSIEVALAYHDQDELSRYTDEEGYMHFGGCKKCLKQFLDRPLTFNARLQSQCDRNPYECEKCLCRFADHYRLKNHQIVHSDERPFKCGECDYTGKRRKVISAFVSRVPIRKNRFPLISRKNLVGDIYIGGVNEFYEIVYYIETVLTPKVQLYLELLIDRNRT